MNVKDKGLWWLTPLAMAVTLAACGGNGSSSRPATGGDNGFQGAPLLVMHNGSGNAGQVDRLDGDLNPVATFNADANEGIALDLLGNLYAANDSGGAPSSLQALHKLADRAGGAAPDAALDRMFPADGSMTLKGIAIAHQAGLVMAANTGGNSIEVFGTAAGTPDSAGSVSNIHGIAYRADTDTLVITDVGDAALADDGRLYVIESASSASGSVTPARTLAGPATRMGNPVDLVLHGDTAYIAEKSNDAVLVYRNVFSGDDGDVAPDRVVDSVKPESLALVMAMEEQPDLSDIDTTGVTFTGVAVTSNPPAAPTDPDVVILDTGLTAQQRGFTTLADRESLAFNQMGDAYVTYDAGVGVVNRLATGRDGDTTSDSRDRAIEGANTGLVAPKGFDVADGQGWVLITDNGDPAVRVFGAQAGGNVAPLFTTDLTVAPWDLDYDPDGDRLYVALTDGTVAVFDEYSSARGTTGADRIITPAEGGTAFAAPTNLHGIVHVAETDQLILSDVGSGANPTDGKLYVLDNAASADGLTDVAVRIDDGDNNAVGNTQLGNPVDIAFDGEHLYVAEKSQGKVLRFDNILDSAGGDVTPSLSYDQASPESVSLIADYLGRAPQ